MRVLPLAAAVETANALVQLFVVLLAAKVGDELFKADRQPAVIGEVLAGVVVGSCILGLVAERMTNGRSSTGMAMKPLSSSARPPRHRRRSRDR